MSGIICFNIFLEYIDINKNNINKLKRWWIPSHYNIGPYGPPGAKGEAGRDGKSGMHGIPAKINNKFARLICYHK